MMLLCREKLEAEEESCVKEEEMHAWELRHGPDTKVQGAQQGLPRWGRQIRRRDSGDNSEQEKSW